MRVGSLYNLRHRMAGWRIIVAAGVSGQTARLAVEFISVCALPEQKGVGAESILSDASVSKMEERPCTGSTTYPEKILLQVGYELFRNQSVTDPKRCWRSPRKRSEGTHSPRTRGTLAVIVGTSVDRS